MKKQSYLIAITLMLLLNITDTFAQKKKPLFNFPFGVQAYTFRKHFPVSVENTLDKIQAMGITELESSGAKGLTNTEYKKLCNDRGISIPSAGCSYEQLEKNPQEIVDNAKALGAKYVMCAWIPHKGNEFTIEDVKKAVEVFNKAGKVLKENGLTFCYHDHGYEFRPYEGGTLFDYMVKNTNPAYVSFEMDVLWTLHGGANPEALLQKYGSRWKLMHVKDLKKGVIGDSSGHTPAENDVVLGTGQANWPAILKIAKKIGIKHYFIEDESEHELENVPLSLTYLKGL
ncbi:sugar phosphate isomerase/epimerase [Arcicella aquatica]|uniref:Sugar phosphate isomerase/epimerase n=1 Tax=Arcicella aquatica TaxID=217141 RepID=A0ABU5QHW0_9BACT|nr:sugar phosphate isomerase/epimerase [Arcicella aquatica]MEA5256623.1 sugar phosphate isomerase/epimerase [Arcicella aquatica]